MDFVFSERSKVVTSRPGGVDIGILIMIDMPVRHPSGDAW